MSWPCFARRCRSAIRRAGAAGLLLVPVLGLAQDAQEEINKQIAKLTSDAISARLVGVQAGVLRAAGAAAAQKPNNAWGSYTNFRLKFSSDMDDGLGGSVRSSDSFTTDVGVLGYDRDLSRDTTVGVALDTAKTRHESGNSWGLSPYLAYRFSEHYFAIAKFRYGRFEGGGAKADSYSLGGSLNTVQPFGDWTFRGEAGLASTHTKTRIKLPDMSSSDSDNVWSWNLNGQGDYRFGDGWMAFAGLSANGSDESHSTSLSASAGVEKAFNTDGAVQLKYETKVADNLQAGTDIKTRAVTVSLRWRF